MKQFCLFIGVSIALSSLQACSSNEPKQAEVKKVVANEKVSPDRKLSLEIEGMVCEKGCGASIRKALKEMDGVANCTFDFKEERQKNVATVEFDKDKVTADQIIKKVTTINEKQFSVTNSSSAPLEVKVDLKETADNKPSNEESKINVTEHEIEMPNLLKLLSGLLVRN